MHGLEEGKVGQSLPREHGPADFLISDSGLRKYEKSKHLVLSP